MSYYKGDTKTLTPQQAAVVRTWAERRFADAMDKSGPLVPDERRTYQVASLGSGMVLEVSGASNDDGARVQLAAMSGAAAQSWRVVPLTAEDAGWFEIASIASGKCVTLGFGISRDGSPLVQMTWQGKNSQKWRFLQDESGELSIVSRQGGNVLGMRTLAAGSKALGTTRANALTVATPAVDGSPNQRWRLLPVD
jgi:hypothetical protein